MRVTPAPYYNGLPPVQARIMDAIDAALTSTNANFDEISSIRIDVRRGFNLKYDDNGAYSHKAPALEVAVSVKTTLRAYERIEL